ncbi:MAG: hypothetical protein SWE60_00825 [Thermodesulfobacteriota bacterium]|nr:hypothetical protein [Thermodesulfobacteriota bacterium]
MNFTIGICTKIFIEGNVDFSRPKLPKWDNMLNAPLHYQSVEIIMSIRNVIQMRGKVILD